MTRSTGKDRIKCRISKVSRCTKGFTLSNAAERARKSREQMITGIAPRSHWSSSRKEVLAGWAQKRVGCEEMDMDEYRHLVLQVLLWRNRCKVVVGGLCSQQCCSSYGRLLGSLDHDGGHAGKMEKLSLAWSSKRAGLWVYMETLLMMEQRPFTPEMRWVDGAPLGEVWLLLWWRGGDDVV